VTGWEFGAPHGVWRVSIADIMSCTEVCVFAWANIVPGAPGKGGEESARAARVLFGWAPHGCCCGGGAPHLLVSQ